MGAAPVVEDHAKGGQAQSPPLEPLPNTAKLKTQKSCTGVGTKSIAHQPNKVKEII